MARSFYFFIAFCLVLTGNLFLYFHFLKDSKPKPKPKPATYWKHRVKAKRPMPEVACEAGIPYTFKATGMFKSITLNGYPYSLIKRKLPINVGKMGSGNNRRPIPLRQFTVQFVQQTSVTADFLLGGTWVKDGYIEIFKNKRGYPLLIPLGTGRYDNFGLTVQKGYRLDIKPQRELFYVEYFKNGKLTKRELIKNEREIWIPMWDAGQVRFQAAEVPFALVLEEPPKRHTLNLTVVDAHNRFPKGHTRQLPQAYYLRRGEIANTEIWLDAGDLVSFEVGGNTMGKWLQDRLLFSSESTSWNKIKKFSPGYGYTAKSDGYMKIKALKDTVLYKIKVKRRKNWELKLRPDETRQITAHKGDIIKSYSDSRYYVDGRIMEPKVTYKHERHREGVMTFKASVNPRPISVWVVSRRGI